MRQTDRQTPFISYNSRLYGGRGIIMSLMTLLQGPYVSMIQKWDHIFTVILGILMSAKAAKIGLIFFSSHRTGSGLLFFFVRIGQIHFLTRCRKRRLNKYSELVWFSFGGLLCLSWLLKVCFVSTMTKWLAGKTRPRNDLSSGTLSSVHSLTVVKSWRCSRLNTGHWDEKQK